MGFDSIVLLLLSITYLFIKCKMSAITGNARFVIIAAALVVISAVSVHAQNLPDSSNKCDLLKATAPGGSSAEFSRDGTKMEPNVLYARFSQYDPNYFISNFGQEDLGQVKFQFSFKFDLGFNFKKQLKRDVYKDHIYFAYTQLVFVDLYNYSAPTKDINFTPILLWEHRVKVQKTFDNKRDRFFLNCYMPGLLHQSNGQSAGYLNRSIFRAFINADFVYKLRNESTSVALL